MAIVNPAASDPPTANDAATSGEDALEQSGRQASDPQGKKELQQITFGSGCFWCTEAVFAELEGVASAVSGYSGGRVPNPTYEQVCSGTTGHAEVVQVTYDPSVISVAELLEVFWQTHDPTTLNRQGNDVGTQYRSVVFYHNDEQRREAEHYKKRLDESGAFDAPIVTEIAKFEKFYPAEKYHQDYYALNPNQGYCQVIIRPKLDKFRKAFKDKLKGSKTKAADRGEKTTAADPDQIDWKKIDWKERLDPHTYHITREAGTERPFTGKYWNLFEAGEYRCSNCGLQLFESTAKFDAGCGWPSFDRTVAKDAVTEHEDKSFGMRRIEVRCRRCGAHLGHVFDDGPTDTGLRYCMNSASLKFIPADEALEGGAEEEAAPKEKSQRGPK